MEKLELSDRELRFLNTQLQFVRDSLQDTRRAIVEDRSLGIDELLKLDGGYQDDMETAEELAARVQREIHDRGLD
jgi:hypothetical protein